MENVDHVPVKISVQTYRRDDCTYVGFPKLCIRCVDFKKETSSLRYFPKSNCLQNVVLFIL